MTSDLTDLELPDGFGDELDAPPRPQRARLGPRVRQVLRGAALHPERPLCGFTLSRFQEEPTLSLGLTLARDEERLQLWLCPLAALPEPFLSGNRLALSYDESTPINTQEKRAVALRVLRLLERLLPSDWEASYEPPAEEAENREE